MHIPDHEYFVELLQPHVCIVAEAHYYEETLQGLAKGIKPERSNREHNDKTCTYNERIKEHMLKTCFNEVLETFFAQQYVLH